MISGKQLTLNLAKSTLFATCINVFSLGDLITLLSLIQWPGSQLFSEKIHVIYQIALD